MKKFNIGYSGKTFSENLFSGIIQSEFEHMQEAQQKAYEFILKSLPTLSDISVIHIHIAEVR